MNNLKLKFFSYLRSGHDFGVNESRMEYKVGFINTGIVLGGFTALVFALIRFFRASYTIGIVDLVFSLSVFLIVFLIRKDKKYIDISSKFLVLIVFTFFMLMIYNVQNAINLTLVPIFFIIALLYLARLFNGF